MTMSATTIYTLMEKMGSQATEAEARVMADILVWRGYDVNATAEIPEDVWLAMLDEAVAQARAEG
jgi:hypothetical protein